MGCKELIFLVVPFGCLTVIYIALVWRNKQSTGEIKFILPPQILLKVFAVFMIMEVVFVLAINKIINESTIAALIGAIATGTLGLSYPRNDKNGEHQ